MIVVASKFLFFDVDVVLWILFALVLIIQDFRHIQGLTRKWKHHSEGEVIAYENRSYVFLYPESTLAQE